MFYIISILLSIGLFNTICEIQWKFEPLIKKLIDHSRIVSSISKDIQMDIFFRCIFTPLIEEGFKMLVFYQFGEIQLWIFIIVLCIMETARYCMLFIEISNLSDIKSILYFIIHNRSLAIILHFLTLLCYLKGYWLIAILVHIIYNMCVIIHMNRNSDCFENEKK